MRRVFAQKFAHHTMLLNGSFYVFFLLPVAVIIGFATPHNFNIGTANLLLLLGGSLIWPLFTLASFRANKDIDAGIYAVIANVSPAFTLLIAVPFLNENLSGAQYLGTGLLIASGSLASWSQLRNHAKVNSSGILFCILSAFILGVAIVYERLMLNRVDFGTYILLGWGAQVGWAAVLAYNRWNRLPSMVQEIGLKHFTVYGLLNVLKSVCFISALLISGSAALFSSAANFLAVVVIIAAYFVLHERRHIAEKIISAFVGITGLLLIAS